MPKVTSIVAKLPKSAPAAATALQHMYALKLELNRLHRELRNVLVTLDNATSFEETAVVRHAELTETLCENERTLVWPGKFTQS